MQIEEAIKILEYPVYKWSLDWDDREDGLAYCDAIEMAIAALRAQQTSPNDPLTLEELRKMAGEPIKKSPCDLCQFNPPSSTDGKPCSICPASAIVN